MMTRLLFRRSTAFAKLFFSCALTVFVCSSAIQAAAQEVEIVKPADGAVLIWTSLQSNQQWSIEVAPTDPNNPPPCYTAVVQYSNPPGKWKHMTGVNREIGQPYPMSFPISWFGDDAAYRIRAAANPECRSYNLNDVDQYVWTGWNSYTIERRELTLAQAQYLKKTVKPPVGPPPVEGALRRELAGPGEEGMVPRSGDAPQGFGSAVVAPPAAMTVAGGGGAAGDGSSKVEIIKPLEGQTVYYIQSQPINQLEVTAAAADPANSPGCYLARITVRSPSTGNQWSHAAGSLKKSLGQKAVFGIATAYHPGAEHRVEVAGWDCSQTVPNPRDFVSDDAHAITIVMKEGLGFKAEVPKAVSPKPGPPVLKGGKQLTRKMKALPSAEGMTPRSGMAPYGPAAAPLALKKAKLPPGHLVIDEFIKTSDPKPGDTVNVKVKLRNRGPGPSVKDRWRLVVKCHKAPDGGACEQLLGPIPLASIPKDGFVWKLLSGAVKVKKFGSYTLQANVYVEGKTGTSAYLEFRLSPPKVDEKKIRQVPAQTPRPDAPAAPSPRRRSPMRRQVQ